MFTDNKRELIVVTTVTSWDEPPRIRHQVSRQLLNKYNILFVQLHSDLFRKKKCDAVEENLLVTSVGFRFRGMGKIFRYFPSIERLYMTNISNQIEKKVRNLGYKSAKLINFQFDFPQIYQRKIFNQKIYICNDDFINMNSRISAKTRAYLARKQNQVISAADYNLAVSPPLVEMLKKTDKNAELLLPGVEYVEILAATHAPSSITHKIKVAFMGFIDLRLNIEWVAHILEHSKIEVTLIGPIHNTELAKYFSLYKNIFHLPSLLGRELAAELTRYDVLIMPYKTDLPLIQAVAAPNKLFQYFAAGRPVVISDMPNFMQMPKKFVYKASTKQDFLNKIIQAKNEDSQEIRISRVNYAKLNSWETRVKILEKYLSSVN